MNQKNSNNSHNNHSNCNNYVNNQEFRGVSIETLAPLVLLHAGRPAMVAPLYLGHGMRAPLTAF